jgi:iron(III) transport system ATP-binding protein
MTVEVLNIIDLSFAYKKNEEIFSNINFSLNEGEILGILGPSGTGKSSLLRLITGLEKPSKGEIYYYGREISGKNNFILPSKRGIGLVLQEKVLFPHLNALENVKFGIKGSKKEKEEKALSFLRLLKAEKFSKSFPNSLSGGEQQRVAIARALAPKPSLVLLDEPFSSLDTDLRKELRNETKALFRENNTTCILVTHDLEEAASFCDKVVKLEDKKIKEISI